MVNKKNLLGVLVLLLVFTMAFLGCSIEMEESWQGDHYGKLTIKNQSSYSIMEIKVLKYNDESGDKIIDTNQLVSQSFRTYKNDDVMRLEYTTFSLYGNFKQRIVKVKYNNTIKSKTILLSEGQDVELILSDTALVVTNPIYEVN
jgi:hypothetical protein